MAYVDPSVTRDPDLLAGQQQRWLLSRLTVDTRLIGASCILHKHTPIAADHIELATGDIAVSRVQLLPPDCVSPFGDAKSSSCQRPRLKQQSMTGRAEVEPAVGAGGLVINFPAATETTSRGASGRVRSLATTGAEAGAGSKLASAVLAGGKCSRAGPLQCDDHFIGGLRTRLRFITQHPHADMLNV